MRIQHNIAALNSYRNLTNNNSAVSKNLEKLSSGYRINRAGDDAAGLAISEKMRAQITGLETAQKNANDGISLVQTAEGALTEVHSMLNRMVELANQSANGTYDNEVDRANLQKEVDSLLDEINRISDGTNFNGINLLDGTYGSSGSKISMGEAQSISLIDESGKATITISGTGGTVGTNSGTILHKDSPKASEPKFTIDFSTLTATESLAQTNGTATATIQITIGTGNDLTITVSGEMSGADIAAAVVKAVNEDNKVAAGAAGYDGIQIGDYYYKAEANGDKVTFTLSQTQNGAAVAKGKEQVVVSDTDLVANAKVIVDNANNDKATFSGSINTGSLEIVEGVPKNGTQYANAEFDLTFDMIADGNTLTIGGETYTFKVGKDSVVGKNVKNVIDLSEFDPEADNFDEKEFMEKVAARLTTAAKDNAMFTVGAELAPAKDGVTGTDVGTDTNIRVGIQEKATYKGDADLSSVKGIKEQLSWAKADTSAATAAKSLTLQIGDTSDDYNKLKLHIDATDATTLGIADINIGTQEGAAAAVDKIKAAINTVSSVRGDLGAIQNRLEHTINNLSVTAENMTAAESRIRDVDMAKEMMAYTKNNILVQASQAMLAQANQVPQGVLQLLQ